MTPKKIELQDLNLTQRSKKLKEISKTEYLKIKNFIDKAKNGESNGVDIKEATERKYIDCFIMTFRNIKKPLLKLTKDDLTKLKHDLKTGKIKSRFGKPYSDTSIREMQLILIRFLESVAPEKYSGFKKWFVIKVQKKSVDYLKESEIEKLFRSCKSNAERFLIAVLFDGGFRASEFLNVRFGDIEAPTQSFPYYKILIKEEYSKTSERNIGMYWKHSTDAIRDYLEEQTDKNPKAPVYNKTYDSIRIFLSRLGKRVLHKRIYFHIFRKSSASYYALKLKSRQQLCYRFGWRFSSGMPDVYISRVQGEEEVKESFVNTSMQKLEKENQELQTKQILQDERMENLEKQIAVLNYIKPTSSEHEILKKIEMKNAISI